MRICHATNFWPVTRFGHTHYTDALIGGLRDQRPERHFVAADDGSDRLETEAYTSVPCFSRHGDYVEPLFKQIAAFSSDVVVVQYSEDLFGNDDRLPRLLNRLRGAEVPTMVVYHSVYPDSWKSGYGARGTVGDFDRAVGREAACVMVHSARMRSELIQRGVRAGKIVVIPHGSWLREPEDRSAARAELELPETARVVLFFGFIWLGKGLDFLLDVFAKVARRVPDAWLYVGGYTRRKKLYTRLYMAYLKARTMRLGIARRTSMWGDFVPDEMIPTMFSAADVVAFPYRQAYSSVSGVLHHAAGMGRLSLCSRIAKFEEVGQFASPDLLVDPWDVNAWADRLTRLLDDPAYAADLRQRMLALGELTSWGAVGRRHHAVYDALVAGEEPAIAQDPELITEVPEIPYRPRRFFSLLPNMR